MLDPILSAGDPTDVMETSTCLTKAQADVVAHARAVAVQNLPGLPCYTTEVYDGFNRWIEGFRESEIC